MKITKIILDSESPYFMSKLSNEHIYPSNQADVKLTRTAHIQGTTPNFFCYELVCSLLGHVSMFHYKIKHSWAVVWWIGPVGQCLGTCLQMGPNTTTCMRLVKQKAFCLVSKGVRRQAKLACLNTCWMCGLMVWGTVG